MSEPAHSVGAGLAARKQRIALVAHSLGETVFGAERSFLDVLAALDPLEHEAVCILPRGDNEGYLKTVAQYTKSIHIFPYQWWHRTRRVDPASVAQFEAIFRRERVDLVHVNTITLMDPLAAARSLGVPGVVHARELIRDDATLAAILGEDPDAIVRLVQEAADFVIGNSDATCRLFGRDPASFRLYNSVDTDRLDLPSTLEPGRLRVGIISSNIPKKGVGTFVRLAIAASHRRPGLEFLVIGPENEHTKRLEEEVRQEPGTVHIRFIGYVADSVEALRQLDVVVSCSDSAESFGRTILEAMAARRPVVAWDRGGTPEIIRQGKDGFLVPYPDTAEALRRLEELADDPEFVREMGRNGRERAREMFSRDAMALRLKEIYRRIGASWAARQGTTARTVAEPAEPAEPASSS